MGIFDILRGAKVEPVAETSPAEQQAVLVYLDGLGLPDEVYEACDTSTIEDLLIPVLEATGMGEFDGTESGPAETCLFMYGPDAEALFVAVEPVLVGYPLCSGARVIIRRGGPGAPERELRLPVA